MSCQLALPPYRRTYAAISTAAIEANIREVRSVLPNTVRICAVVKSNAYGHGSVPVSAAAADAGADMLAVAMAEEALPLRQAGIRLPVLVLGPSNAAQAALGVQLGLDMCAFTEGDLLAIEREAARAHACTRIHLKVDTGMSRIGIRSGRELETCIRALRSCPHLELVGVFSHFANADEPEGIRASHEQARQFVHVLEELQSAGFSPAAHISNSAGFLNYPAFDNALVRIGIALYGYPPDTIEGARHVHFEKSMQIFAEISYVKEVPEGTPVGYGSTVVTTRPSRIATVQIGYGDGYPRLLSGRGQMIVKTDQGPAFAPILGRVCMDMTMIDVTDRPGVQAGDQAIVLGSVGDLSLGADDIAQLCGTISYEVLCDFTARLPRIVGNRN